MADVPRAGVLAAWGSAALGGAVSPDDAAQAVTGAHDAGHRVVGLPGETDGVTLAYALLWLRASGATGLRLVLPRPGDLGGLAGPPDFATGALSRGAAVLTVGSASLGLLPEHRGTWSVHDVEPDRRTPVSARDAGRSLDQVMRESAALLVRLDLARWDPAAAEMLRQPPGSARATLPPSAAPELHLLLQRGQRVAAIVELARCSDGAAVTAVEMLERAQVLRDLDRAARRAVEAACSATAG